MTFTVHAVYYTPDAASVTIVVRAVEGPFAGQLVDLHTTQPALDARCAPGVPWSDDEVRAEASALLAPRGGELAL